MKKRVLSVLLTVLFILPLAAGCTPQSIDTTDTEEAPQSTDTETDAETEPEDVLSSLAYAREVSELSSLPLVLTSAEESVAAKLQGSIQDLFPMRLQKRPV